MRVREKGSDREAEVHLNSLGSVNELEEFCQYVDPVDKAICCYVPVEKGSVIRVKGTFSGRARTFAYDVAVDGILRKYNVHHGKSVTIQKRKKIGADTFLYQIDNDETLDTEMKVASASIKTSTKADCVETVGTVELRLFVLRREGEEHRISNASTYYNQKHTSGDKVTVQYKSIAPEFVMEFEENCAALDKNAASKMNQKINARRPGREVWAIFRFHYRSMEFINDKKMKMTFDPKSKKKAEVHDLMLDPYPELHLGTKPAKAGDTEDSTRGSSPPHSLASTPVQSAKEAPSAAVTKKKQPPKSQTPLPAANETVTPKSHSPNQDLQRPSENGDDHHSEAPRKEPRDQPVENNTSTPVVNGKPNSTDEATDANPLGVANGSVEGDTQTTTTAQTLEGTEEPAKLAEVPAAAKPGKDANSTSKPALVAPEAPMIPIKRTAEPNQPSTAEAKRTKLTPNGTSSPVSSTSTLSSRVSKTSSIIELRKQVTEANAKRGRLEDKQRVMDEHLTPYKKALEEERLRLEEQLKEEARLYQKALQRFNDDADLLAEFKKAEKSA